MRKTVCYHTRCWNTGEKLSGGTFFGDFSTTTADRLVESLFGVCVKRTGTPVFVDAKGREVFLYFSVDPEETQAGRAALTAWRAERVAAEAAAEQRALAESAELAGALRGLTHAEALRRLRGA